MGGTQQALFDNSQILQQTILRVQAVEENTSMKNMRDEAIFMDVKSGMDDMRNDILFLQGVFQNWGGIHAEFVPKTEVENIYALIEYLQKQLRKRDQELEGWENMPHGLAQAIARIVR
jgi:hypothetical protein